METFDRVFFFRRALLDHLPRAYLESLLCLVETLEHNRKAACKATSLAIEATSRGSAANKEAYTSELKPQSTSAGPGAGEVGAQRAWEVVPLHVAA